MEKMKTLLNILVSIPLFMLICLFINAYLGYFYNKLFCGNTKAINIYIKENRLFLIEIEQANKLDKEHCPFKNYQNQNKLMFFSFFRLKPFKEYHLISVENKNKKELIWLETKRFSFFPPKFTFKKSKVLKQYYP